MKTLTCALVLVLAASFGCKGKQNSSGDSLAKMGEFKDAMCKCKDAACAQDVSSKLTKWTQEQARSGHPAKLSDADTAKAQSINDQMGKCMATAVTAAGSAAPVPSGSAGSSAGSDAIDPAAFADLPQECLDYRKVIARLASCGDKLPADVREVLEHQFDQSVEGWAKLPAEAKKSLGPACTAGISAVESTAKAQCGW